MSPELRRALIRALRVAVVGGLVGAWHALQGDPEVARLLAQYGWALPALAALGKWLRDKLGWTWLPF